eukprot:CCRYP_006548-RA/>CCRYP_006548-RA protein AED:0.06 eAED:0.06 QI:223/1/1/1/1/1/2/129/153
MAKSIRSKSKRKNRTEFRNTIGAEAAKTNMEIIQAKLQQCVNSGQLNSFDRLSNLFAGKGDTQQTAVEESDDIEMSNADAEKDSSKIPSKKSSSQKHSLRKMAGQYGDKTSRKLSEKRQRQGGRGRSTEVKLEGRKQRSSSKKRSGKKLATIS